jgi:hypothetical protein
MFVFLQIIPTYFFLILELSIFLNIDMSSSSRIIFLEEKKCDYFINVCIAMSSIH